ncbi:hypothetical protein THAOC_24622 [Thalassiosira oceanica]|uniref:Uncharacterized protein n=1 Tax=Thalassiosira oceanica TaxID=159749 RepID=K0RRI5_THAOC|nr:hypothetical protein THAOC_24622 [Thalassiosira oceanica]|eukprot:EJK55630.1 hypothetical protein THAOC_24622 [Thalassiosira oceanica]
MPKEPPQKSKQQQEREAAKDLDEDTNAGDYARQRQHRNDGMRRSEAPRAETLEPVVVRGRRVSVMALIDMLVVDLLRQEFRKQEGPDRRREAVEKHVIGPYVRHPKHLPGEQHQHRPDHAEREAGEGAPQREAGRGRRRGEDRVRRGAHERGQEEEDGAGHAHAPARRAAAEEPRHLPLEGEFAEDARYNPVAAGDSVFPPPPPDVPLPPLVHGEGARLRLLTVLQEGLLLLDVVVVFVATVIERLSVGVRPPRIGRVRLPRRDAEEAQRRAPPEEEEEEYAAPVDGRRRRQPPYDRDPERTLAVMLYAYNISVQVYDFSVRAAAEQRPDGLVRYGRVDGLPAAPTTIPIVP